MGQSLADRALEILAQQATQRANLGFSPMSQMFLPRRYIGPVATRTACFESFQATLKFTMTRTTHYLREDVSALQVAFPGFYISGFTEHGFGATTACTASVEYPAGTFTQLRFGGAVTGTIPDNGILLSDPAAVIIPRGAQFWVRTFQNCTAGSGFHGWGGPPFTQYTAGGEFYAYSATSIADQTMGGTIVSSDLQNIGGPCAIVGLTNRPTVALIGDSRIHGEFDVFSGTTGDIGGFARAVGPLFAYMQCGAGGDTAGGWATSHANRAALAAYCSHGVVQYGINDINLLSHTDAAIRADIATILATLPSSMVKYISTLEPCTTSTDNFATLANQTVLAGEATRLAQNVWRRSLPSGFSGVIDAASVVESLASPGKWLVDGTAFKYTADGVHESQFGYQAIASSGVVPTGLTVP